MADEAPASQVANGAAHTAGDHDVDHNDRIPTIHNGSRKSTLTKSAFDFNVTGHSGTDTDTPMTFGTHRHSKMMPDLDEYFVYLPILENQGKLVEELELMTLLQ
jgi:hypothetical protein